MRRSWNNKTELHKDGTIHQLERLNKKLKALPVKKQKQNGKRQVSDK